MCNGKWIWNWKEENHQFLNATVMNLDEITKNECRSEKIKAELCKIAPLFWEPTGKKSKSSNEVYWKKWEQWESKRTMKFLP